MLATDRKLALSGGREKRSYVRAMFTAIAPRYDLLNHVLSLNIDRRWRRKAVARLGWGRVPAGRYLDVCAGTLDLAATLGQQPGFAGRVIGADFVLPMLSRGKMKSTRVWPVNADALELPFPDRSFDGATVGFGVRNLADLDAGLAEAARVLRPGARFVILEFSTPPSQPLRGLYFFYFRRILPLIGRLVSRHGDAYSYLPESVLAFPEPDALAARMRAQGFHQVEYTVLLGGICAIHVGTKR
jgi:demethylmenaquinone methyltransferase/2-methoxy-6-polyprenyl-1,4-benzoquinol methylase